VETHRRVLLFPRGNNCEYVSLYLDVANADELPYGWKHTAQFFLSVVNQLDEKSSARKETSHTFNARESDWGFTQFMPLGEVHKPGSGFLLDDVMVIHCEVEALKEDNYLWDSKKETGCVGLKNQGATCYMNSLLQTLFHLPKFRKAVYRIPTEDAEPNSKNIPLALQRLFYKLQFQETSVATKELTRSFGWEAYDSFMQHDVQELNRVLCEKLEEKMKGTSVDGTISNLFEGNVMNYIKCVNVDYNSTRKESFMDLQLDVKGCKNVYDSFDKYVEVEMLDGENKYRAEGHGLQDAKKGVLFTSFPPVLFLQLKRFEYDFMRDTMVKINDRYEFPETLDLDVDDRKFMAADADADCSKRNTYSLHSVLVHSGGVNGGHYYAFIRPDLGGQWLKFDDERVSKVPQKVAVDEQFGGSDTKGAKGLPPPSYNFVKFSNAYMLVYVRNDDKEDIMCKINDSDIADHLREGMLKEQLEKEMKRKEKDEAHLFTVIKVARHEDLAQQIGHDDAWFDLVNHDACEKFKLQKTAPFLLLKEQVAEKFGIPVEQQRYWLWSRRQNHTYRPTRPLTLAEEAMKIVQVKELTQYSKNHPALDLKLLLERTAPGIPKDIPANDILLFVKHYDPHQKTLRYLGHLFADAHKSVTAIYDRLAQLAGFEPGTQIEVFEEIKFEPTIMCDPVDPALTLHQGQLENGDILCIQKKLLGAEMQSVPYPTVPQFFEYVVNRVKVVFKPITGTDASADLELELSKQDSYLQVVEELARELGIADPRLLRLTKQNVYSGTPASSALRYNSFDRLIDILYQYNQLATTFYYEIVDMPLPELEKMKVLTIKYHSQSTEFASEHEIRVPRDQTIGDVLLLLKEQLGMEANEELRLMEVYFSRISRVFAETISVDAMNDQYWTLRAEEVTDEEKHLGQGERVIQVCHFTRDSANPQAVQNFGEPFLMVLHETETLEDVKPKIQARLKVKDSQFAKWKFAAVSTSKVEELEDEDIVLARMPEESVGQLDCYLGLEHDDKLPRRNPPASNRAFERPVRIFGD